MLCDYCKQQDASVHITQAGEGPFKMGLGQTNKLHLCTDCADKLFAASPGTNQMRNQICLSDFYRTKLFDLLEATHPEVFYRGNDNTKLHEISKLMESLLREQLKKDGVELNEDAFQMLRSDLCFSHHYYDRADDYNKSHAT